MRIDVTQDDIDDGRYGTCHNCPVARALNRARHRCWFVAGDWAKGLDGQIVPLPLEVRCFIHAYDHGELVEPFSFEVEL